MYFFKKDSLILLSLIFTNFGCESKRDAIGADNEIIVICSDIDVFKEIGNDAVLKFKQNNYEDLARKIELLIKSEKLRSELIKKGLKRLEIFSNENFINSYEKLFKSLK